MASLALGVAGAAIGGYFGGPTGAKWGWVIGSAVGGSFESLPDVNGPKLTDTRITGSGYGRIIKKTYGSLRQDGNVIWSTPRKPTKHSDNAGAKGGPSQTVNTTTYSLSCAVAVNDGEIAGVSRIWMNGKLVYDIRATNTSASGVSGNIRVYTGSETQMPDSLIVAIEGSAPAYLGLAYVVFEDLQLADFGNDMPNFEFEVVQNGTWSLPAADVHGVGGSTGVTSPFSGLMFVGATDVGTGLNPRVEVWDPYSATKLASVPLNFGSWAFDYCCYVKGTNEVWFSNSSPIRTTQLIAFNCDTFSISRSSANVVDVPYSFGALVYVEATNEVWMPRGSINTNSMRIWDAGTMLITGTINQASIGSSRTIYVPDVDLVFISDLAGVEVWGGTSRAFLLAGSTPTGNAYPITYDSVNRRIVWGIGGGSPVFYYLDVDTLALTSTAVTAPTIGNIGFDVTGQRIITYDGSSQMKLWDSATFTLQQTISGLPSALMHPSSPMTLLDRWVIGIGQQASASIGRVPIDNMLTSNPVLLKDIVTDISATCGLSASDIDVSQLTDLVYGYSATGTGLVTGRASIEPLMTAFLFDAVESS
jgi:hypothetical protein